MASKYPLPIGHSSVEWIISCLLANLKGQGKKTQSQQQEQGHQEGKQKKTEDVRMDLLKVFLSLNPDVIFFQEISFKTRLYECDELQKYYKEIDNPEAGILVKPTVNAYQPFKFTFFTANVTEWPNFDADFNFMEQLKRMCIVKIWPVLSPFSVAVISYHGPTKGANCCKLYTDLLKAWNFIRKKLAANYAIIGGDFNYSIVKFKAEQRQPCYDEGLTVYPPINTTILRKKEQDKIDYFIVSTGLVPSLGPFALEFSGSVPENTNFKYYFDHSPIVALFKGGDVLDESMAKLSLVDQPPPTVCLTVLLQQAKAQQTIAQQALGQQAMDQQAMAQYAIAQQTIAQQWQAIVQQAMAQQALA